jgi:hypothetical protein
MSALPGLKERIRNALAQGEMTYFDLAVKVFPADHFPKAFRYQRNGGPPGCYMALSRALREMSDEVHDWHSGIGPGHRHVRQIGQNCRALRENTRESRRGKSHQVSVGH